MKKAVLGTCLMIMCLSAQSQTWDEWFRQKTTVIRYLTEQVAALKAYGSVLKKGYNIAQNGLGAVQGHQQGEFALHQQYQASLRNVKPAVRTHPSVDACQKQWQQVGAIAQYIRKLVSSSGQFAAEEQALIVGTIGRMKGEADRLLEEVQRLTGTGEWQMEDSDRLKRLQYLLAEGEALVQAASQCRKDILTLAVQRSADAGGLKKLATIF